MPFGIAREISVLRVSMATLEETNAALVEGDDSLRRRDFINIAAVSFAGVGAVAVVLPLINQMNPSADVLALASTEVDISKIAPGQAIKTSWRKQPVFVRNLTPKEVPQANAVPLSELRDPQTLAERTKPGKENWLITLGVCTHLGCVPLGVGEGENRGEYRRLFLPVPRFALRHRRAHPQRPGADEPDGAGICFHVRHRRDHRLRGDNSS